MPTAGRPAPPASCRRSSAAIVNGILINIADLRLRLSVRRDRLAGRPAAAPARGCRPRELRARPGRRPAERAVFGERVRIARELHDVVAHHVSVMGIQAAAGRRVLDKDPARPAPRWPPSRTSARTAVDELRRMLGALRAPDADRRGRRPPPALRPGRRSWPTGPAEAGLHRRVRRRTATRCRARLGVPGGLPDRAGGGDQHPEARPRGHASTSGSATWPASWRSTSPTTAGAAPPPATAGWGWSACGSGSPCTTARWRPGRAPTADSGSGPGCRCRASRGR